MLRQEINELTEFLDSLCVAQNLIKGDTWLRLYIVDPTLNGNIQDGNYTFALSSKKRTILSVDISEEKAMTQLRFEILNTVKNLECKPLFGENWEQNRIGMLTNVKVKMQGAPLHRILDILTSNAESLYLA